MVSIDEHSLDSFLAQPCFLLLHTVIVSELHLHLHNDKVCSSDASAQALNHSSSSATNSSSFSSSSSAASPSASASPSSSSSSSLSSSCASCVLLSTPPSGSGELIFLQRIATRHRLPEVQVLRVSSKRLRRETIDAFFHEIESFSTRTGVLIFVPDIDQLFHAALAAEESFEEEDELAPLSLLHIFCQRVQRLQNTLSPAFVLLATCSHGNMNRLQHPLLSRLWHWRLSSSAPNSLQRLLMLQDAISPWRSFVHANQTASDVAISNAAIDKWLSIINQRCQGRSRTYLEQLINAIVIHAVTRNGRELSEEDVSSAFDALANSDEMDYADLSSNEAMPLRAEAERRVTWDDIVGLDGVKARLREAAEAIMHADRLPLGLHAPVGVLLYGVPGCGKTLLAQCLASIPSLSFLSLSLSTVLRGHIGESERLLNNLFDRAIAIAPCVVFIDEVDALFAPREEAGVGAKLVSVLASVMDEIDAQRHPVLVLGATNLPFNIDASLLRIGRFEWFLHVPLPSLDQKCAWISKQLVMAGHSLGDDNKLLHVIVQASTIGFSIADCKHWLNMILLEASASATPVSAEIMYSMRSRISGSSSLEMIHKLARWRP